MNLGNECSISYVYFGRYNVVAGLFASRSMSLLDFAVLYAAEIGRDGKRREPGFLANVKARRFFFLFYFLRHTWLYFTSQSPAETRVIFGSPRRSHNHRVSLAFPNDASRIDSDTILTSTVR